VVVLLESAAYGYRISVVVEASVRAGGQQKSNSAVAPTRVWLCCRVADDIGKVTQATSYVRSLTIAIDPGAEESLIDPPPRIERVL